MRQNGQWLSTLSTTVVALSLVFFLNDSSNSAEPGKSPSKSSSLVDKIILGYQGWFTCPDDKTGPRNWGHWINSDGTPAVDIIPDTSDLPQQPGCRAPFIRDANGRPVMLYSAQNETTVDGQMRSLEQFNIAGVALQRFVSELRNPVLKQARDQVLVNLRTAAERHGRVFFITYDITGARQDWVQSIEQDWNTLVASGVTTSAAYLQDRGHPVVEIWGLGWDNRPAKPRETLGLMKFFTQNPDENLRTSVIAGVPVGWRDMMKRKSNNPSWDDVYKSVSVISPWMIGAFKDKESEDKFIDSRVKGDIAFARANGQVYMPVIFPGFSSFNQSHGQQAFNSRPRKCGGFLNMQISSMLALGVTSFYGAMYDEANEGTALFRARLDTISSPGAHFLGSEGGCDHDGTLYLYILEQLSHKLSENKR